MAAQFIYTMRKLSRFYPPDRQVLEDITLAMYPGAKIGVLGSNGAGKSSLLRIMAGLDDGYTGEARLTPGFTVGMLAQEPELDPDKDVLGNVMDGVGATGALLERYNEVCAAFADPDADMDALLAEQAELQDKIDASGAWDLERTVTSPWTPCGCRPATPGHDPLRWRAPRVALCRLLLSHPDLLLLDEPTNHLDADSVAWLERFLRDYSGTVVAITHDRYFLDNVAGWILELERGRGSPSRATTRAGSSRSRRGWPRRRSRSRRASAPWSGSSSGCGCRPEPARPRARLASRATSSSSPTGAGGRGQDKLEITIPPAPRLGDVVVETEQLVKGFGDRLLIDGLTFSLPPAGSSGVVGPTAPARPRCSA
jgi:ATPase subunit of ABC transporter with duplicated ATPase domains